MARFIYDYQRSHFNHELRASDVGTEVTLMGWVQNRRDHGGVIFVDLRDKFGLTQIVFNPEVSPKTHKIAEGIRLEYCLGIKGNVSPRPDDMKNSKLATGDIEVLVTELEIFNESESLPFLIEDHIDTNELVRLEYRFLDLRRKTVQKPFHIRSQLSRIMRNYLHDRGFEEIETPFLTKSTPEGARDYLVPSRLYEGEAYALPQSPQLFKQILMMSGFDKYFQIARCFRDEDLRADRQPEFTQLDLEMSFVNQNQIFELMEGLFLKAWKEILGSEIKTPFLQIPYREAIEKYGSDKPDLRLDWELKTVSDIFLESDFKVFKEIAKRGDLIQTLRVPGGEKLSRKDLDDLTPLGQTYGAKGIAWIKINDKDDLEKGWQSPIAKFLSEKEKKALLVATQAENGDVLVFSADRKKVVSDSLGFIRNHLGKKMGALREKEWQFLWVTDFPLFQYDPQEKRWVAEHHPFTSPKPEYLDNFWEKPEEALGNCYDLVLNGNEMGSGSIRIHQPELQKKVFELLNFPEAEIHNRFGFLMRALSYGAPPHGGVAMGLDRFAMLLAGKESLRDVIAFPKTQKGTCPLTGAPSKIDQKQWDELHLRPILKQT